MTFPSFRFVYQRTAPHTHNVFHCHLVPGPQPTSFPGEMRVQLLNQTLLDLGLYDDGPYEVADQKQLNAQLIPVPYHSYLGRICPSLLTAAGAQERKRGPRRDDAVGLQTAPHSNQPQLVIKAMVKKNPIKRS